MLEQELQRTLAALAERRAEVEVVKSREREAQHHLAELEDKARAHEALRHEVEASRGREQEAQSRIAHLETELSQTRNAADSMVASARTLEAGMNQAQSDVLYLTVRLRQSEALRAQHSAPSANLRHQLDAEQQKVAELEQSLSEHVSELTSAKRRIEDLERSLTAQLTAQLTQAFYVRPYVPTVTPPQNPAPSSMQTRSVTASKARTPKVAKTEKPARKVARSAPVRRDEPHSSTLATEGRADLLVKVLRDYVIVEDQLAQLQRVRGLPVTAFELSDWTEAAIQSRAQSEAILRRREFFGRSERKVGHEIRWKVTNYCLDPQSESEMLGEALRDIERLRARLERMRQGS